MSAAALSLCWGLLVVWAGVRWRPRRGRSHSRAMTDGSARPRALDPMVEAGVAAATALGATARLVVGLPADAVAARRLGAVALAGGAALVAWPPAALVVMPLVAAAPRLRQRRRAATRAARVAAELPHTVDLLVVAGGAGLPPLAAVRAVAPRCPGATGAALRDAARRIELGEHPDVALDGVLHALGEGVRPLVAALRTAHRDGTRLGPTLERVAADARATERRRAEEAARRVPVRMLLPLVLCTLPAFALLTVVPLLVSALGSLQA